MANIKNLQMWNTICTDSRISISKSLFGLRTTATYIPTNSIIDAATAEYSPANGERIKRILTSQRKDFATAVAGFHPEKVVNGNYLAEYCISRDGTFLAVQLLQFAGLSYESATDVLIFEGDEARLAMQLFSK